MPDAQAMPVSGQKDAEGGFENRVLQSGRNESPQPTSSDSFALFAILALERGPSARCSTYWLWPTASISGASSSPGRRRGEAIKFDVRYTFNCALWFENFEHPLTAICGPKVFRE
jgi:hypothetical protein